jgi:NitT/TauT family transport system ATP-binding protein
VCEEAAAMVKVAARDELKLVVRDVGMTYTHPRSGRETTALEDIALEVRDGEFITLVGPSGSGKSTLLALIDGQLTPTRGTLQIDGAPIKRGTGQRAMVFQDASLFPWLTAEKNAMFGLQAAGKSAKEARERVREVLRIVGVDAFAQHYPHELSGGMQQRVNLARALAVDPDILLMDEPFAALDAQTRYVMQEELLKIWRRTRKTVIFVTHQIGEAIFLSDRIVVLSGRPGTVTETIPVDLPRPRELSMRRDPRFGAMEDHIWSLIEGDVRRSVEQ